MNSRVSSIQASPRITQSRGWAYQQCNGEAEKDKQKERIEHERASCCSIEPCLTGRAQEVWVTLSKINTLTQRRAGSQNERMAGPPIRRQAEGMWIRAGHQHVVGPAARRWDESEAKRDSPFFFLNKKMYHLFSMCCPWIFHMSSNRSPPFPFLSHSKYFQPMEDGGHPLLCAVSALAHKQAAVFAGRGPVLCLAECGHCHPFRHTPSILYFPVGGSSPVRHCFVLCPHWDRKVCVCWGTKLPLWGWLTGKFLGVDRPRQTELAQRQMWQKMLRPGSAAIVKVWKAAFMML